MAYNRATFRRGALIVSGIQNPCPGHRDRWKTDVNPAPCRRRLTLLSTSGYHFPTPTTLPCSIHTPLTGTASMIEKKRVIKLNFPKIICRCAVNRISKTSPFTRLLPRSLGSLCLFLN